MGSQSDDGASAGNSGPKRAAARGPEKRGPGDEGAKTSVPAHVPTQPGPVLPLSLDFALRPATDEGSNAGIDLLNDGAPQGAGANSGEDPKTDIALPAPPDMSAAPPSGALPKELTFALKLDPHTDAAGGPSGKDTGKTAQEGISTKLPAPVKSSATAVKAVEDAQRSEPQPADTTASRTDAFSRMSAFQASPPNQTSGAAETNAASRLEPAKALEAAAVQTPTADSTSKAGPLKELSIQVGPTQQDRVELRVVDRSGEVQVAVRASNPDVAQGLRQGLSDLVGRLEQNGYRAEAWRPGGTVASVPGTGESRQKEMQFQRDGSEPQSGGSQQGRQQNSQNQNYRPRWVQELEGSISGGSNTGDSYGITS
jgi:hypothetical protein